MIEKFDICNEQIMNHCDPDLCHDRIFRGAEKAFDLEILLDPFEKQLDLPSLLVNFRDGGCRQSEVIGDETICFRRLPVKKLNQPQFSRLFL